MGMLVTSADLWTQLIHQSIANECALPKRSVHLYMCLQTRSIWSILILKLGHACEKLRLISHSDNVPTDNDTVEYCKWTRTPKLCVSTCACQTLDDRQIGLLQKLRLISDNIGQLIQYSKWTCTPKLCTSTCAIVHARRSSWYHSGRPTSKASADLW